jgi:TFIIF-interacting CTD phosphatase-like protein|tara:strand:- start:235 stop:501 length:267 start_codon:yes stop_codon:yes gene_type:complete
MVHCIDDRDPPGMIGTTTLKVLLNSSESDEIPSLDIHINIRPGLIKCLNELKKSYQIVSFTASDQLYADAILDHIDPFGQIFCTRLYR